MKSQKLTPEQVEKLFVFTRQHHVEWYDLQLELVDHLANAIEEQWQKNPKLLFEEALNSEFKKFGIFGFEDVIEKKKKAMTKVYNRFIWQNIKNFFTISTTIVTFSMILLLFQLLSLKNVSEYIFFGGLFCLLIIAIWHSLKLEKIKKERFKIDNKKWLLEEIISKYGNYVALLSGFPQILSRLNFVENIYLRIIISICFIALLIFLYVIMIKMPLKVQDYLKQIYPEYKFEIM